VRQWPDALRLAYLVNGFNIYSKALHATSAFLCDDGSSWGWMVAKVYLGTEMSLICASYFTYRLMNGNLFSKAAAKLTDRFHYAYASLVWNFSL